MKALEPTNIFVSDSVTTWARVVEYPGSADEGRARVYIEVKDTKDPRPSCHIFPANMKTRALRMLLAGDIRMAKVRAPWAVPAVYTRGGPRDEVRILKRTWRPSRPTNNDQGDAQ